MLVQKMHAAVISLFEVRLRNAEEPDSLITPVLVIIKDIRDVWRTRSYKPYIFIEPSGTYHRRIGGHNLLKWLSGPKEEGRF